MKIVSTLLLALVGLNIYNWCSKHPITFETFTKGYQKGCIVDVTPAAYNYRSELVSKKVNIAPIKVIKDTTDVELKVKKIIKKTSNIYDSYLIQHLPLALEVEKIYGVPAELTLAQAIHESSGGQSYLGKYCHNHFGIKAMKGYRSYKGSSARWTIFESVDDGFMAYGRIVHRLINQLYPKGFDWDNITAWDIAKTAYAGKNNFDYARKCDAIIEQYNIVQLADSIRVAQ